MLHGWNHPETVEAEGMSESGANHTDENKVQIIQRREQHAKAKTRIAFERIRQSDLPLLTQPQILPA